MYVQYLAQNLQEMNLNGQASISCGILSELVRLRNFARLFS